jgi:purine-cytosine permease-like protein
MATRLRERPTSDLVIVFMAGIIGLCVILGVLGLVALKIADPDEDIDTSVKVIGDILTVMLGAVIGFVAGKASTNGVNGNGNGNGTKPPNGQG